MSIWFYNFLFPHSMPSSHYHTLLVEHFYKYNRRKSILIPFSQQLKMISFWKSSILDSDVFYCLFILYIYKINSIESIKRLFFSTLNYNWKILCMKREYCFLSIKTDRKKKKYYYLVLYYSFFDSEIIYRSYIKNLRLKINLFKF